MTIVAGITGADALRTAVAQLRQAGVETPERDARRLLSWAINEPADRLALALPETLDSDSAAHFRAAIDKRVARIPVSHITGRRLFWGREFHVEGTVLHPRPETETLIAEALAHPFERVLDLGTGSGCILITLLAERPRAIGTGTDLSDKARTMAEANATALAVSDRAEFVTSDWFDGVTGRYDLIVSNPPYIAADEMAGLAPDVRDWEPAMALTDGADGLSAYRAIAADAGPHLTPGGRLLVEIGPTQAAAVTGLFSTAGLEEITVHPDLDGRDRVVSARRNRA
ncbi:MAG: peptide chain release factor N(5)-glutamine methyltransferase [Alphaproteobacteria bacterium]|nr:peptide chain release factor N(5)-glutamine methyltransferase [Alphaproteobacteria bacterium]